MSTSTDQSTDQPGESTTDLTVLPDSQDGQHDHTGEHVHTPMCSGGGCGHKTSDPEPEAEPVAR